MGDTSRTFVVLNISFISHQKVEGELLMQIELFTYVNDSRGGLEIPEL